MPKNDKIIVYSVNTLPHYFTQAENSIRSLRNYNKKIPIFLVVHGHAPQDYLQRMIKLKVQIKEVRPTKIHPHFQKWLALREVYAERVLFVDTDTFFFADVEKFFKKYHQKDYYARQEFGMEPKLSLCLIGTRVLATILDVGLQRKMAKALNARILPIFNSGFALFNNGTHRKIIHGENLLLQTRDLILQKKLKYPFPDSHMHEQITAAMALGKISGLTYGFIHYQDAPFYIEWKAKITKKTGWMIHTWNGYYNFAVQDFMGKKALKKQTPDASLYRAYRPNGLAQHK